MPHQIDLILTLSGGLTAALIFGFVTQRIGLSPIVGYLLAGIAVSPSTPEGMSIASTGASPTSGARSWDDLPDNAKAYIRRIEALINIPIDIVSVGPERDQAIIVHDVLKVKPRR